MNCDVAYQKTKVNFNILITLRFCWMSISNLSAIINHHLMIQVMNTHLKGSKHCNPKRIYKWNLMPWARLLQRSNNTKTTTLCSVCIWSWNFWPAHSIVICQQWLDLDLTFALLLHEPHLSGRADPTRKPLYQAHSTVLALSHHRPAAIARWRCWLTFRRPGS